MPKCVLIVEDEALLRRTLANALREAGFRAVTADSAEDAEPYLFPRPDVDLVVLDNRLPKARGIAVLQRLRQSAARTPVILMTAYDQAEVRAAARELADGYVVKPFDLGRMIEEVQRLLGVDGRAQAGRPRRAVRGPARVAREQPASKGEGGDPGMARRRKSAKSAAKKTTRRRKASRKKGTKKATRRRKKASTKKK